MSDLSTRGRIYCSYGAIEPAAIKAELPELSMEDKSIVSAIMQRKAEGQAAKNPWQEWQKKNDWRAEGLLKFVGLKLPMETTRVQTPVPCYKLLFDLPGYCYDMHTRIGLAMLKRLVQGVQDADAIKDFFHQYKVKNAHKVLGEALFFVQGGRIEGEPIYEPLCCLEQRLFAYQFGLPLDKWLHLRGLVEKAMEEGIIDRVREEVLHQFYGERIFAI